MEKFPLYHELSKKQSPSDLQWIQLTQKINSLTSEQSNILYSIILYHYILEQKKYKPSVLPYNSKTFEGGRGILFSTTNIPQSLQSIIYHFLNLC